MFLEEKRNNFIYLFFIALGEGFFKKSNDKNVYNVLFFRNQNGSDNVGEKERVIFS